MLKNSAPKLKKMSSGSLTEEQIAIIDGRNGEQNVVVIEAGPGVGKTHTLAALTKALPEKTRVLYLPFNRRVAEEAREGGRFAKNTTIMTLHAMAAQHVIERHPEARIEKDSEELELAIMRSIARYLPTGTHQARMTALRSRRGPLWRKIWGTYRLLSQICYNETAPTPSKEAGQALGRVLNDMRRGALPMPYMVVEFLFARWKPKLPYDICLIDEAQDTNINGFRVLTAQLPGMKLWVVGDDGQRIYGFRKSMNIMTRMADKPPPEVSGVRKHSLSQSFRFGPRIAELGNALMGMWGDPGFVLRGNEIRDTRLVLYGDEKPQRSAKTKSQCPACLVEEHGGFAASTAYVCRTNLCAVAAMVDLVTCPKAASHPRPVFAAGPEIFDGLSEQLDALQASPGGVDSDAEGQRKPKPSASWRRKPLEEMAVEALKNDEERGGLHGLARLVKRGRAGDERNGTMLFSTTHQAKGGEWPTVIVAPDYWSMDKILGRGPPEDREIEHRNFLYVAVTRGIDLVLVPAHLLTRDARHHANNRKRTLEDYFGSSRPGSHTKAAR